MIAVEGDDIAPVRKANEAGLAVQALSRWRVKSSGQGGMLLSFTNITSPEMASQVVQRLRRATQTVFRAPDKHGRYPALTLRCN